MSKVQYVVEHRGEEFTIFSCEGELYVADPAYKTPPDLATWMDDHNKPAYNDRTGKRIR